MTSTGFVPTLPGALATLTTHYWALRSQTYQHHSQPRTALEAAKGGAQRNSTLYLPWATSTHREVQPKACAPHGAAEMRVALVGACACAVDAQELHPLVLDGHGPDVPVIRLRASCRLRMQCANY